MAWDQVWDKVFKDQEWGKYPGENLIQFTARNFYSRKRSDVKILELGCGPGPNVWYLAREGFTVCGIDGSVSAIEKAKARLKQEGLKADLIVGDIKKLDFKDASFDAVIDNECLYCNSAKDTEMILKEIKRVLKKDGLLYSRTFRDDMYVGKTQNKLADLEYDNVSDGSFAQRGMVRLTSRQSIKDLYGKFLSIISVDKLDYTYNNEAVSVKEWVIISQKKESD